MRVALFYITMTFFLAIGCQTQANKVNDGLAETLMINPDEGESPLGGGNKKEKERIVLISTDLGDIKIKLYNETPLHRDNFIKLVNEHFYDSCLFHRVINEFMVQGGDPKSKGAAPGIMLGEGGPGYTVPSEFNSNLIHKKGALAAARMGDQQNPLKASSGSQFYIVLGKAISNEDLDIMEQNQNTNIHNQLIMAYIYKPENAELLKKIEKLQQERNMTELQKMDAELRSLTQADYDKAEKFKFSDEQRKIYTTVGGTPHLDGGYTVYGEVIEGIEIVEKIGLVKVDANSRPNEDIKMQMKMLN